MRHSRLWWTAVLIPVAILGGIELLADWVLDPYLPFPLDTAVVTATALALAVLLVMVARRRMDLLARALDARTRELERRGATARALHQLGTAVSGTRNLDASLQSVTDAARQMLEADVAFVLLQDAESARLAATSGPDDAFVRSPVEVAEPAEALQEGFRHSIVAAPLHRGERTIGSLAIAGRTERTLDVDELGTLSSLASLLTLAIENARLEAQLREMAVRGERERIAREMHDGLAQVLGYVNTKSQAVEALLQQDRTEDARGQLAELAAAARSIYVDVREAILGLASPVTPDRGLVGALEEYAARFAASAKIAVAVDATPEAAATELSAETEAQVFRIVQEALTNVRKHASASRVTVAVRRHDATLEVTIADDGRGLPHDGQAAASGWPRFGLASMRERAASVGAVLEIANGEGGGTRVTLRLVSGKVSGPAGAVPV